MPPPIHPCPFALGADGTVVVNAALFDGVDTAQEIFERAIAEPGALFIGVVLDEQDMQLVAPRIASACSEAAAFVIGRRQKIARKRK